MPAQHPYCPKPASRRLAPTLPALSLCALALAGTGPSVAQSAAQNVTPNAPFVGPALGLQVQRVQAHTDFGFPVGVIERQTTSQVAALSARYGFRVGEQGRLHASLSHSLSDHPGGSLLSNGAYRLDRPTAFALAPGWTVSDRVLVYGLLSYERVKARFASSGPSGSTTLSGWGVGAGLAYALTPALALSVEFKQVDYGSSRLFFDIDTRTRGLQYGLHYQF